MALSTRELEVVVSASEVVLVATSESKEELDTVISGSLDELVLVISASPDEVLSALETVTVFSVSATELVVVASESIEEVVLSGSRDELVAVLSASTDELEIVVSALGTVLVASLSTAELVVVFSIKEDEDAPGPVTVLVAMSTPEVELVTSAELVASVLVLPDTVLELVIDTSRARTVAKSVPRVSTARPEIALKYTHSEALAVKEVPTH